MHGAKLTLIEHATHAQKQTRCVERICFRLHPTQYTPTFRATVSCRLGRTDRAGRAGRADMAAKAGRAGRAGRQGKQARQNVRLTHFCLCQIHFLEIRGVRFGAYLGGRQTQKVLVLSSEMYWAAPGDNPPPHLSVTEISTSASDCLVLQSETKAPVQT